MTDHTSREVVGLGSARSRSNTGKRAMRLSEEERRILLADLAEIAAELDAMYERAGEITARLTPGSTVRLVRPA